ncbi:MAG: hypothetical protein KA217_11375 [Gammaproteobacteria bacterium]|nr:hypothetical protein [Gammaproteobacteria bacterium]
MLGQVQGLLRQPEMLIATWKSAARAQAGRELDEPQAVVALRRTGEVWEQLFPEELSRRLELEPGWVAELLRLTLLAHDLVEAVLAGRQPRHLNLQQLRGRGAHIPWDWERQRELFGLQAAEGKAGGSEEAGRGRGR